MRLNDSTTTLQSRAKMVIQLCCPDALKVLPGLTGHGNVPSAHFGHKALRTFNWTITHKEKKKTNHIIELLSASAGAIKGCVVSAVFAPAAPEGCLHWESRWPWLLSRCATDGLYLWATRSGWVRVGAVLLCAGQRVLVSKAQEITMLPSRKQERDLDSSFRPQLASSSQPPWLDQEELTLAVVFPHNSWRRPSPPEKATNFLYFVFFFSFEPV